MKSSLMLLALFILLLLAPVAVVHAATPDDMNQDLSRLDRLIVPVSEQCSQAQPPLAVTDFENGISGVSVKGAVASLNSSQPIFGTRSMDLALSGTTQATIKLDTQNTDPLKYTGIMLWAKPSVDGIKVSIGVTASNGIFTSRSQTLRYSGEALPVYIDFASMGGMSKEIGGIMSITVTFYPTNGGNVEIDDVSLVDASYGSFNRAWWDEAYKNRYVDQRYQETINDYLSLYTLRGASDDNRQAIIRGMDNIILSRQPDGWVEGRTTGLITAGTMGSTLANAYLVMKDDPAMDEKIDVYGDTSHTRRWWVEKSLDMDVRFIDYLFTTDPNSWIVRNQLLEGARAVYCSYLATGDQQYLSDYRNMMSIIKAGRQNPLGIYPEWTNNYDTSNVMYDSSYSAVQFSILTSLSAMGDKEYALPMAKDLFSAIGNVIDPSTGMVMNLNSSRKDIPGDLRWDDAILYSVGQSENIPGFVHLGYLENRIAPGKAFSENFHNGLARYYDLKYYQYPATDSQYRLPLECPVYSIDILDISGNVVSTLPAAIDAAGNVKNPQPARAQDTFLKVNGFGGSILPGRPVTVRFEGNEMYITGSGPVMIKYSGFDLQKAGLPSSGTVPVSVVNAGSSVTYRLPVNSNGTLEYNADVSGTMELRLGDSVPNVSTAPVHTPTASPAAGASYPLAIGLALFVIIILSIIGGIFILRNRKN